MGILSGIETEQKKKREKGGNKIKWNLTGLQIYKIYVMLKVVCCTHCRFAAWWVENYKLRLQTDPTKKKPI